MAAELSAYIQAGLALDPDERAVAAHRLLASLHEDPKLDDGGVDAAWNEEIDRRVDDVLQGRAHLVDIEEAHAEIRAQLAARRK